MTIRLRLIIVTVLGLIVTMALWGWVQIRALDLILVEQQGKRLLSVAETVSSYYSHFPTGQGLSALDATLKEQIQTDFRLARIDIFTVVNYDIDYIEYVAGAGRIRYEWPDELASSVAASRQPKYFRIKTEEGPAAGLLFPGVSRKSGRTKFVVGVIAFSKGNTEILAKAQHLLYLSAAGLLLVILIVLAASYRWIIDRPLGVIIGKIDGFQAGKYRERIPISRQDELGRLSEHFNAMAEEIERVIARNAQLTGNLEILVREETQKTVELQKEVNQLQKLAAMGYLTATLAHDLGTPLHSIAGLTSLLREKGEWPPDVVRKLELIAQQTSRLQAIIKKVKLATRPPDAHFETVDIADIINETVSLAEPLFINARTEISVHCEKQLPLIHADRHRIQTAIFNILQNSLDAMPAGGHITVAAGANADGKELFISISDKGAGIRPEIMDKVCEPFFSTHEDGSMRGLGLAIVHDSVKIHGGRMTIDSSAAAGTEVRLYFPVRL